MPGLVWYTPISPIDQRMVGFTESATFNSAASRSLGAAPEKTARSTATLHSDPLPKPMDAMPPRSVSWVRSVH